MRKAPKKKTPARLPILKGPQKEQDPHARPGYTSFEKLFDRHDAVQGTRDQTGHVHLDVRLFDSNKAGLTMYVCGDVGKGIDWLIANRDKLKKAVRGLGG